jgi:serine protease SohB
MPPPADLLADLGIFTLKALVAVLACLFVFVAFLRAARGDAASPLRVARLDRRWQREAALIARADPRRGETKGLAASARARLKRLSGPEGAARVFTLRFDGGLDARGTRELAAAINAILQVGTPRDEVVLRLKSPGGLVTAYGHAASQLARVREAGLRLTVAVDEVAASGGYLMAAMADHIIAAPFALVGSIGVVGQIPNVHRLLKRHDVDVELHTAGRFKRTLTVLGENTDEGRAKFRDDIARTFERFKEALARHRPRLDLERVATGETWYGSEALALGLVDAVETSDAYLLRRAEEAHVLAVAIATPSHPLGRLGRALGGALGARLGARQLARDLAEAQAGAEEPRLL